MTWRPFIQRETNRATICPAAVLPLLSSLIIILGMVQPVGATTLYWDCNGNSTGGNPAGGAADGDWDLLTPNWNVNAGGTGTTQVWVDGSDAVFSAGSDVLGEAVVKLIGSRTVGSLRIEDGTVTLDRQSGGDFLAVGSGPAYVGPGAQLIIPKFDIISPGAGHTLTLDGGTLRNMNVSLAPGVNIWNSINNSGEIQLTSNGGTLDTTPQTAGAYSIVLYGGVGFTLSPGTTTATLTKTGSGEMRLKNVSSFTTLDVQRGLLRVNGTGGQDLSLGTSNGTVITHGGAVAGTTQGAALGTSISIISPVTRSFVLDGSGDTMFALNAGWTINGPISGLGGLMLGGWVREDTGAVVGNNQTLTLGGTNTYAGNTTINFGTLSTTSSNAIPATSRVIFSDQSTWGGTALPNAKLSVFSDLTVASIEGGGGSTLRGALSLNGSGVTLTAGGNNQNFTYSGSVTGAGSFRKIGTGTMTIENFDWTNTGNISIDQGAIRFGNSAGFSSNSIVTIAPGATLDMNNESDAFGALAGGGTVNYGSAILELAADSGTNTFTGNITGTGQVTKSHQGIQILSGNNNLGPIVVYGGALYLNGSNSTSYVIGGTLGGSGSITSLLDIESGRLSPGTGDGNSTLTAATAIFRVGSLLECRLGPGGNSDKLTVTNNNGLLIDGATVQVTTANGVTDGTYRLINYNGSLGSSFSHLEAASQAGFDTFTLINNTAQHAIDVSIVIQQRTWQSDASSSVWSNGANWGGNPSQPDGPGAIANFLGTSPGNGAHIVTIDNADKSVGVINLNNATKYTINATSPRKLIMDTWGADAAINSISGSHEIAAPMALNKKTNVTVTSGSDTLTISGTVSGTGVLQKSGAGALTLSAANTFTGNTVVSGGTLFVANSTALQNSTLDYNNAGGFLIFSNSISSAVLGGLTGGQSLTLNNNLSAVALTVGQNNSSTAFSGTLNGGGSLTKTGSGTLALNGANTYGGGTIINQGTLSIVSDANLGNPSAGIAFSGGTLQTTAGINSSRPVTLNSSNTIDIANGVSSMFSGAFSGTGSLIKTGGGTLILAGSNTYGGVTTVSKGMLQVGNGGTGGSLVSPATSIAADTILSFNRSGTANYAGVISGAGSVTKTGNGTLTFTGTNTYTGTTTISQGTLQIGGGGTSGTLGTGSTLVDTGATLAFNRSDSGSYSGIIFGNGNINKTGTGTFTFSGNNIYNGTTTVSQGTLQVGNGSTTGTLGTGNTTISSGATLSFNRSSDIYYAGIISGGGVVTKTGAGKLILASNSSYTGGTTISAGTLQVGAGAGTGSLSNTGGILNNGILIFNRNNSYDYSGVISGNGSVIQAGTGNVTLGTTNTYIGGTTVNAGRLSINGSVVGLMSVNSAGALSGNGTIHGTLTSGGRVAPGNSPGILHIDNDYTQTATSVLEIEVGGLTPGTQHDQVQVGGNAALDGSFEFPIINNFHPQLNDEITFLTANSISGAPKGLFAPNLAAVDPNLGFVVIKNNQDLRLRFVSPTDVHFVDNSGLTTQEWAQATKWDTSRVPTTADKVDLSRSQAPFVQRVEVTSTDAAAYELTIHDQSSPITVGISNGKTLAAAVGDVTIGKNAAVELGTSGNLLDVGTLAASMTKTITLQEGSMLKGNGTIAAGDLIVSKGTISPGFSVGHLDVAGNVLLSQNSTLIADVDGLHGADHDTIDMTGGVELGGTLQIKIAPTATLQAGDTLTLLTADGFTPGKVFQRVETTGSETMFFIVNYPNVGPANNSSQATATELTITGYEQGDMNHDLAVDGTDISYFAMALSDPNKYFNALTPNGACVCDNGQFAGDLGGPEVHSDGKLTFDDIPYFATKVNMSVGALMAAMQQQVPEPSFAALAILCAFIVGSPCSGRYRCCKSRRW